MNAVGEETSDDRLILAGELTIYTASEIYKRMQAHLEQHPQCLLDLSGVSELDGAGLQLLLWLRDAVRRRGGSFKVVAASPVVTEVLELLQLSAGFGLAGGAA